MDSALLQNLMAGAESGSQLIGGLIVALLYAVIGLLCAIGSIVVFRRIFQGRWEQVFWASFLVDRRLLPELRHLFRRLDPGVAD